MTLQYSVESPPEWMGKLAHIWIQMGDEEWTLATNCDTARKLDAGGWFSRRFRGEPVPTLEEALALCIHCDGADEPR